MAEKCGVCHECGQQAAVKEGFLEDLLFKQISGVKGGLRATHTSLQSQYTTFLPSSSLNDAIANLKSAMVWVFTPQEISKLYKLSFSLPWKTVVKSFPTNPQVEHNQDRKKHISGKVHHYRQRPGGRKKKKAEGIHDFLIFIDYKVHSFNSRIRQKGSKD